MKNPAWKNINPFIDDSSRSTGSVSGVSKTASAVNKSTIATCNEAMNDNSNPQQGNKYTESSTDIKADKRKLFIGGLPNCVTDDVFFQYFEKFGKIVDSVVMYDKVTKRSRGFGFVTFEDSSSAQSVIELAQKNDNKLIIFDRRCEVKIAYPKPLHTNLEHQQRLLQNNGRGRDRGANSHSVNEPINCVSQQQCQTWPNDYRQAVSTVGNEWLILNPDVPPSINNYYGHFIHNYPYINGTYLAHGYGEQYLGDVSQTEKGLSPLVTWPVFYAPYAEYDGMRNYYAPPLFYTGNGNHLIDGRADYGMMTTAFPYQTSSLPDLPEVAEHGYLATATATATDSASVPNEEESKSCEVTPVFCRPSDAGQQCQTKLTESVATDT